MKSTNEECLTVKRNTENNGRRAQSNEMIDESTDRRNIVIGRAGEIVEQDAYAKIDLQNQIGNNTKMTPTSCR